MREAMFIKRNAEKWKRYQHLPPADPDETAERFVTLMDDLAFSKTFYPKSKTTVWLNGLAASLFQNIYRNKKGSFSAVFDFWKYDLPLTFKKHHRVFLFTAILFISFGLIGYLSSAHNPDFVRGVLGNAYVDHTEDNIAKGDPFGIYKDDNKFSMFMRIAFNNVKVAFIMFISGFTLGLFTLKALWDNGVMLGSFHHMFVANGLGLKSFLVVWIHGTIEIISAVLAGTSGFILANSILFPGTYTRLEAFRRGAKDAAKVLICLIPFFIIAAFLESYITRLMSTEFERGSDGGMPVWCSVLILAFSLLFMIWYFILRPIQLHRRGFTLADKSALSRMEIHA